MHPNPLFRQAPDDWAHAFARERGFGVITGAGPDGGLMAAHVPFRLSDDASEAEAHLVRSNPLARALRREALDAMIVVSGADAYVSPDWYGEDDRVPTWNYLAVHIRGRLRLAEGDDMRAHLDRLSHLFEAALAPKPIWQTAKMSDAALTSMMRQIVPVRLAVTGIESTVKLNQNRTPAARAGVIAAIAEGGTPGLDPGDIGERMRALPDER